MAADETSGSFGCHVDFDPMASFEFTHVFSSRVKGGQLEGINDINNISKICQ